MSLRLSRRAGSPFWWFTGTIGGKRIRQSAETDRREIAETKCKAREIELERQAIHGAPVRVVGFAAASLAYLEDQPRTETTKARVRRLVLHFGRGASCTAVDQAALDRAAKESFGQATSQPPSSARSSPRPALSWPLRPSADGAHLPAFG